MNAQTALSQKRLEKNNNSSVVVKTLLLKN